MLGENYFSSRYGTALCTEPYWRSGIQVVIRLIRDGAKSSMDPEILIIGGGVIGVCCAYYLAELGQPAVVIDKGEVGAGCSYGNAGLVVPSHSISLAAPGVIAKALKWIWNVESPLYIKPRLSADLFAWMWHFQAACRNEPMRRAIPLLRDLSRASLALHQELAGLPDLHAAFVQKGLLKLFNTSHGLHDGIHEASLLGEYGIPSRKLDPGGVRELSPEVKPEIAGGIYYPEDAHLEPHRFVHGLAKLAEQRGARVRAGIELLGFEVARNNITLVRTTRGDFRPRQVILAAGAWSPVLAATLRIKIPVQSGKGYSLTVPRPLQWSSIPSILAEVKVAVTPMAEMLRFAGTLEFAGLDLSVNMRRVAAIQRGVREYLQIGENPATVEIWRGLRPCTPDGLPIIGRCVKLENLIVATGHGMLGVSLGPITGKVVAQMVCGRKPDIDPAPLRANRF